MDAPAYFVRLTRTHAHITGAVGLCQAMRQRVGTLPTLAGTYTTTEAALRSARKVAASTGRTLCKACEATATR
jgi:hypothetical protein